MAKTKKLAATGKPSSAVKQPPLSTLTSLLGKTVDDPAVVAVFEKAGKVKIDSDFAEAKEAGFDFALERVDGKKKKVLHTLFLFPEGGDGHVGFKELPKGFAFVTRRELLAKHPTPIETWKIGPGAVPVDTPDDEVSHDTWLVDGFEVMASYSRKQGGISHYCITVPEDMTGGATLDCDTVYWEVLPYDAPPDAQLMGMAVLVAWATRHGLAAKHATSELGKQLAARSLTPREFLIGACNKTLTTLDVPAKVADFLEHYTRNKHYSDEGARKPVNARIAELLNLQRDDERRITDDFKGTFEPVLGSTYYVPDSWDAVDRMAPILDARFADFEATKFRTIPDVALYETAAKLRDARTVAPHRAAIPPIAVDDGFSEELVSMIDKPLTDKGVKAILTKAGMPIGKRIDAQANPALGASYMGTKFEIDGKNQLGVEDVAFYADGFEFPIRGLGKTVRFRGFPGLLPFGLRIGDVRATVRENVAREMKSGDDYDQFETKKRFTAFKYIDDKLVMLRIGRPRDY